MRSDADTGFNARVFIDESVETVRALGLGHLLSADVMLAYGNTPFNEQTGGFDCYLRHIDGRGRDRGLRLPLGRILSRNPCSKERLELVDSFDTAHAIDEQDILVVGANIIEVIHFAERLHDGKGRPYRVSVDLQEFPYLRKVRVEGQGSFPVLTTYSLIPFEPPVYCTGEEGLKERLAVLEDRTRLRRETIPDIPNYGLNTMLQRLAQQP